jgi:chemotaxis regulatin CheY-phosphate phosphatase CheZ
MPTTGRTTEVLYDSETVLRLVDHELNELRDPVPSADVDVPDITGFLQILRQANDEISLVLGTLRTSRQALQGVTMERLHDSAAKIREVSSTTESATTSIMDGLDRSQRLIDRLDALCDESSGEARTVRASLRDELFAMMEPLQFQDITSQQLSHVSTMLNDIEDRLTAIASTLGGANLNGQSVAEPMNLPFAESASVRRVVERQAEADALFAPARRAAR